MILYDCQIGGGVNGTFNWGIQVLLLTCLEIRMYDKWFLDIAKKFSTIL